MSSVSRRSRSLVKWMPPVASPKEDKGSRGRSAREMESRLLGLSMAKSRSILLLPRTPESEDATLLRCCCDADDLPFAAGNGGIVLR